MEKNKWNIGMWLVFSFIFGIVCGFPLTMVIVVSNIGNIQNPNGLMFQKDCNVSNVIAYKNLTLWCIDKLKQCNDEYYNFILESEKEDCSLNLCK